MTPGQLFKWLKRRHQQRTGIPFGEVDAADIDALMGLEESGRIYFTTLPPLIWINPDYVSGRDTRKGETSVWVESDLPHDVETLDNLPDRNTPPASGKRNGRAYYLPPSEPSQLYAMGPTPWPVPGCEVEAREYREWGSQWTVTLIHDQVVTPVDGERPRCPTCGHASKHANCLVCDAWPGRSSPVRMEKWDPEEEARQAEAEAKKARAAERKARKTA